MRFRSRFVVPQFGSAVVWAVLGFLWFHKHPHDGIGKLYLVIGFVQAWVAFSCVADYVWNWWGIGETGLIQHRLRSSRTVPWSEITRVAPWQPGKRPHSEWLEVDYAREAPISDRGSLRFRPADRDALVFELRARAVRADFESFSSNS